MAKLTKDQRDALKDDDFVFKKERRYPYNDPSHAVAALARSSQHGTPEEKKQVKSAVCTRYPGLNACKTDSYKSPL
jgi:hypothetical protein